MGFSKALAGIGDATGDGVPDFVTGETWTGMYGCHTPSGIVYVYSAATGSVATNLEAGQPFVLSLSNARELAPAFLIAGLNDWSLLPSST